MIKVSKTLLQYSIEIRVYSKIRIHINFTGKYNLLYTIRISSSYFGRSSIGSIIYARQIAQREAASAFPFCLKLEAFIGNTFTCRILSSLIIPTISFAINEPKNPIFPTEATTMFGLTQRTKKRPSKLLGLFP